MQIKTAQWVHCDCLSILIMVVFKEKGDSEEGGINIAFKGCHKNQLNHISCCCVINRSKDFSSFLSFFSVPHGKKKRRKEDGVGGRG